MEGPIPAEVHVVARVNRVLVGLLSDNNKPIVDQPSCDIKCSLNNLFNLSIFAIINISDPNFIAGPDSKLRKCESG